MSGALNDAELRRAIQESLPLSYRTSVAPEEFIDRIEQALDVCLAALGQEQMKEGLFFCVRELVNNAKKANNKRVYFKERELDIANPADYERGMRSFRDDVFSSVPHYLARMTELGYYIDVTIQRRNQSLELRVSCNIEMVPKEHARVYDRIAHSRAFDTVEEAFGSVLDDSEGAGLGLTIVLLYLRKLGLPEDAFDLSSHSGVTTARLTVPFSDIHLQGLEVAASRIEEEIDQLPTFPEHIRELQRLLGDAEAGFQQIAKLVARDPAFTADLLRYVNSAHFVLNRRVENVVDAVRVAGLRFLQNMLYSYASHKVLQERYPGMRELWPHSQRVAFYAYHIARSIVKDRQLADDVYVAGILHDIGKIIMSFLYPKVRDALESFTRERGMPVSLAEGIAFGISHAQIGARVGRKWNFPDVFVDGIAYHHEPADCPEAHRTAVYTVYLANALAWDDVTEHFEQIEPDVLSHFGLETVEKLRSVKQRLVEAYEHAHTG